MTQPRHAKPSRHIHNTNVMHTTQKKSPFEIRTEIAIAAPAERVWAILTDFQAYPTWNPFIRSIEGRAETGTKLRARIEPPGGSAMVFKPTVLAAVAPREFRWLGHLWFPGLFDGEHIFEIHDTPGGGVRLVQREQFRGILVPLFKKMLLNNTLRGFELMNEKLRERAETPIAD